MIDLALFEPRIPQNTGNIARTCAAFNVPLNLIEPLGFSLEDKYLKRAGLDYWHLVNLKVHRDYDDFFHYSNQRRIISFSRFAKDDICDFKFKNNDILLFGREDTGLPEEVKSKSQSLLKINMPNNAENKNNGVRSLNLSVACGIAIHNWYSRI